MISLPRSTQSFRQCINERAHGGRHAARRRKHRMQHSRRQISPEKRQEALAGAKRDIARLALTYPIAA